MANDLGIPRSVRVSNPLWQASKDAAARHGETVTDVVTRSLSQYVDEADSVEVTVQVAIRVAADGRSDRDITGELLRATHNIIPGFIIAQARVVRRDAAGSIHPYPLDQLADHH